MTDIPATRVVMLCTGNAARSVMGALMLRDRLPDIEIIGAGTHALEGLPMSGRTRAALARHDLADRNHRSHQLTSSDVARADLVVAFAPEHVAYVRRAHPEAADRTATLHHLVAELPIGDDPLAERVAALALADVALDGASEVVDPAGGDEATFVVCADEIRVLIDALTPRF
jgi:protein-tyrosine-phosphatase